MSYQDNPFLVDLSFTTPKWDVLKAHCDGVILYAGEAVTQYDPAKFADHIQKAYDNDLPAGVYWVFSPQWYPDREYTWEDFEKMTFETDPQVQALVYALKHKTFYFIACDFEKRYIRPGSTVPIDPWWVRNASKIFIQRVQQAFPGKLVLPYTSQGYIEGFSKKDGASMYDWMPLFDYVWEARWVWKQHAQLGWGARPLDTAKPTWLNSKKGALIWQFAGDTNTDGMQLDFNLVLGMTKAEFYKHIGFTPRGTTPPVDPDPEYPPAEEEPIPDEVTLKMVMDELRAIRADVEAVKTVTDGIKGIA